MQFGLSALKAYVGMILSTYGAAISTNVIHAIVSGLGLSLPAGLETTLATALAAILGYVAVYFAPNKQT